MLRQGARVIEDSRRLRVGPGSKSTAGHERSHADARLRDDTRGRDGRVRQELAAGVGRSLIIAQIAAPALLGHNHRLSKKSHSLPIVDERIIQTRGRSCGGLSDPFGRAAMHDFIKRFAGGVFFPDDVAILAAAFDDAWTKLQASRASPFAEDAYDAREILAKHIIMSAQ